MRCMHVGQNLHVELVKKGGKKARKHQEIMAKKKKKHIKRAVISLMQYCVKGPQLPMHLFLGEINIITQQ